MFHHLSDQPVPLESVLIGESGAMNGEWRAERRAIRRFIFRNEAAVSVSSCWLLHPLAAYRPALCLNSIDRSISVSRYF